MNSNCAVFGCTITNRNTTMDTKTLRQKILDLAIHGKLVPQDPNDEPASVLLERIKVEKERLIKEGKIKRSKKSAKTSDTPHYENVPFEVPESWVWCRLEDIVCELKYGTSEKSSSVGKIAVLRMGNITNVGTIDYSNLVYSSNDADIEQYSLEKDDLLFNRTNSSEWVGKTAIYKEEQPAIYAGYLIRIRPLLISPDYLNTVMNSGYYRDWCYDVKTDAVNQSNINAQKLSQLMIPIPPLKEQGRIVAEMDKWISLIDIIKNGKGDLLIVTKQAKSKILDLAIHGKLIPQDPNDEPAIELLKRINPSFTPCDNGHYAQLPQGWCYSTIKDIFIINPKTKADNNIEAGFVPMANITDGYNSIFKYETKQWSKIKTGFTHFADGDIAVAKISPCLENRKSVVLKGLPNGIGAGTTELHIFRSQLVNVQFALCFFKSEYFINQCVGSFNGVVGQQRVSKNIIENMIIAIPPINEQKRIVYAIRKIFAQLDTIKESL